VPVLTPWTDVLIKGRTSCDGLSFDPRDSAPRSAPLSSFITRLTLEHPAYDDARVIIDGKAIAARVREEVRQKVSRFSSPPHLVVVLASEDPASAIYVKSKGKAAEETGIRSTQHTLSPTTPKADLLALIDRLNRDPDVDGILVQLPLPDHHDEEEVIRSIDPMKDVDGLHPINAGKLARGDEDCLIPCTPRGCIRLIEESGTKIEGKRAVVVGRSRLVGRPVADLLLNRHATVTTCHSRTQFLDEVIGRADIVIAALGKREFIRGQWIKFGATVIDVGINRDPTTGKIAGDVAFHAARERAHAITPVPGGVGPMTIACLLDNTVKAAERRRK
jgi:methylenetetrahydrofolate dehydrogenase (NADP+) / methenyltetrahydrofolate cyclohydrolase